MASAEEIADKVLQNHRQEIEEISRILPSLIERLRQMNLPEWHREGPDLVSWMNREAADMAKAENDVAITKVTGGTAAIAGGVMTGAGIAASFYTFGLAAPLALAGIAISAAGAATSAGGDVARLSIVHMKTCKIRERCEAFAQRTAELLRVLQEMGKRLRQLSELCLRGNSGDVNGAAVVSAVVLRVSKNAVSLVHAGQDVQRIGRMVYEITQLQKGGVILGEEFLRVAAGSITGSGLSISRAALQGAGAVLNIGLGIWDVVDASGTLKNGGSNAALIRNNAKQINDTINAIKEALQLLDL